MSGISPWRTTFRQKTAGPTGIRSGTARFFLIGPNLNRNRSDFTMGEAVVQQCRRNEIQSLRHSCIFNPALPVEHRSTCQRWIDLIKWCGGSRQAAALNAVGDSPQLVCLLADQSPKQAAFVPGHKKAPVFEGCSTANVAENWRLQCWLRLQSTF